MFRTVFFSNATFFSRLQLTVKDHKSEGEVSCRPVHATPTYIFSGLSAWVVSVLRDKLDERAPHLL
eukprot:7694732-Pyramimonas_sp.AAC.1